MTKYKHLGQILFPILLSFCFATALISTDYQAITEVDGLSANLSYEARDLPSLSGIDQEADQLSSHDSGFRFSVLAAKALFAFAPFSPFLDGSINALLRC